MHSFRDIAFDRSKIAVFLAPDLRLTPDGGVPLGLTISVKFLHKGHGWLRYKMEKKDWEKFQPAEAGARTLQTTDSRICDSKYPKVM